MGEVACEASVSVEFFCAKKPISVALENSTETLALQVIGEGNGEREKLRETRGDSSSSRLSLPFTLPGYEA